MAKDKRTGIYNHWAFFYSRIPTTFQDMWNYAKSMKNSDEIKFGVMGSQNREVVIPLPEITGEQNENTGNEN